MAGQAPRIRGVVVTVAFRQAGEAEAQVAEVAVHVDAERVRRAARHYVETERTWARSVARYRDVYRRVLERFPLGSVSNTQKI